MGYLKDLQWYTALTYITSILSLSFLTYYLFWHTHFGYQSHPLWHAGCSLSPSLIHTLIDYLHLLVKSSPLDEIITLVPFVTSSTSGEIITLVIFHMEWIHHPLLFSFSHSHHTPPVKSSPSSTFFMQKTYTMGEVITHFNFDTISRQLQYTSVYIHIHEYIVTEN